MKKLFKSAMLVLVISLVAHLTYADSDASVDMQPGFGVSIGYWISPNVSGGVSRGLSGTLMNLNSDLGFGSQSIVTPEISYRFPHGQILSANYNQIKQTVSKIAGSNLEYSGVVFPMGTSVSNALTWRWSDIAYEMPIWYDSFPPKDRFLNVVAQLKVVRGSFSMTNPAGVVAQHDPITEPFPMFGLHGEIYVAPQTSLHFRAVGIYASYQQALGYDVEFQGGITQEFYKGISATADFRYDDFHNSIFHGGETNVFSLRIYGPQVSINGKF